MDISNKIKLGLMGLALSVSVTFSNVNAQENPKEYKPKYRTISHKLLKIEKDEKNYCHDLKILDNLIENSKEYFPNKKGIKGIFTKFFPKEEYYSKKEIEKISKNIYSNLIEQDSSILKRDDLCYRTALAYLAVGQKNNLRFYASMISGEPGHILVRHDSLGNGHDPSNPKDFINRGDINIETTNGNTEGYQDDYYITKWHVTEKTLEKSTALKNLTKKELLSIPYWMKASSLCKKNKFQEALYYYNKSLKLNPNSIEAIWGRGNVWRLDNNPNKNYWVTLQNFERILELRPLPKVSEWTADYHNHNGNKKKALERYTETIDLIDDWMMVDNLYEREAELNADNEADQIKISKFLELQILKKKCLKARSNLFKEAGNYYERFEDLIQAERIQTNIDLFLKNLENLENLKK